MEIRFNVVNIRGAAGRGHLVIETNLVDGVRFFHLKKRAGKVARILLAKCLGQDDVFSWDSVQVLNGTDIVEQLHALRNAKVNELMEAAGVVKGRFRVSRARGVKTKIASLPSIIKIEAPSVGSAVGRPLRVLCGRGQTPLMIELCVPTLNYLAEVVHHQISQAAIAKKHPRDDGDRDGVPELGGTPGLTYLSKGSKAGKVKARKRTQEPNIVQTKYFLHSQIGEAKAFVGGA